jgi:hypothetical protein
MERKLITYMIVFLLGMFVMPDKVYACNMDKSSLSHKIILSKKTAPKDCCDKKSSSKEKGCTKSCDDSKCHCSFVGGCTSSVFGTIENENYFFLITIEKKNNFHYNALVSKEFLTVWAPPKIS